MAKPIPGVDVPLVDLKTGLMTQTWLEYFQSIQKLGQLPDVSKTAPTNGQVLAWSTALQLWVPSAN